MVKFAAARAVSFLWLSSLLGAGCGFLTQVILARELGPGAFGTFAAALGIVTLASPLASFGVPGFWLKAFGEEGWVATRWLGGSFRYISLTTGLVLIGVWVWAASGPHDATTALVLLILSTHIVGQVVVELVGARFQLEERYGALAAWRFVPHFIRLVLIAALGFGATRLMALESIAVIFAVVAFGTVILGIKRLAEMNRGGLALKGHSVKGLAGRRPPLPPSARFVAEESWAYGLAGIFYLIYFQSDLILLKYMVGDEAAGVYNVAFVVMTAVYIFPTVLYQKYLLPKIHRWAAHDHVQLRRAYRKGNGIMLGLGVLAGLALWLATPWGIPFLFGSGYEESISAIGILALAAPARFLASSAGAMLSTQHHIVKKIQIMGLAAGINVALNIYLIPEYGYRGAAASTVATEFLLLLLLQNYARTRIFSENLKRKA